MGEDTAGLGFKSGTDALLLAAYVLRHKQQSKSFVELGSGEGLATRMLMKTFVQAQALLVDCNATALAKAQENFHVATLCQDLAQVKIMRRQCESLGFFQVDCVLANPPYHGIHSGRISPDAMRNLALHQQKDTLTHFCTAAYALLGHHGHFFVLYTPTRLGELCTTLEQHGFGLRSLLPVHTRPEKAAQWVLLQARKDAKSDLQVEPSLSLYTPTHEKSHAALTFCPWL